MASGPVMSWIIAPSRGAMTTSPALISLPHFFENIFSTIVAAILWSPVVLALSRLVVSRCRTRKGEAGEEPVLRHSGPERGEAPGRNTVFTWTAPDNCDRFRSQSNL